MEMSWDLYSSHQVKSSSGVGSLSETVGLWKATESADLVVMTVSGGASHHGEYKTFLFESDEV